MKREELIAERARLQRRIDEIDRLLRGELVPSMSVHQQVLTMLEQDPSKAWTADQLGARLLADVELPTIWAALSRLTRTGHAERVSHGRYRSAHSPAIAKVKEGK